VHAMPPARARGARRSAAVLPASAAAGPPGTWTRLTDPATGGTTEWSSFARTGDGVLHVAWRRGNVADPNRDDLVHTPVAPNGAAAASTPIVTSWGIIGRSAIVADPAVGLRVLVGGQATTTTGAPNEWLSTATSADGGATWALSAADVARGVLANEGPTAAVVDPTGAVFSVFGAVRVHRGLVAPADSETIPSFQARCCGGYANLAATESGQVWLAWHSAGNDAASRGILYQAVDPATGGPSGASARAARATREPPRQPVALAALRTRPGVLLAYPTPAGRLEVLDVVSGAVRPQGAGRGNSKVALAADGTGRAWLAWRTRDGRIAARRSNVGATAWGAIVRVPPARGTSTVSTLVASAQDDRLDLVAQLQVLRGSSPDTGTAAWHTQVRPGLTLVVAPSSVRSATGGVVRFRVLDAGDPVAGARVRVGSRTRVTDAAGRASLAISDGAPAGVRAATASRSGYVPAVGSFRVR